MCDWEGSCWWPIELVLLQGKTRFNYMSFPVVFSLLLKSLSSFPSSEHSGHLRDYCGTMQRDGEEVLTGRSWQTVFKPLEKRGRLTPRLSLLITLLIELVSVPASRFYNHLITACSAYSWDLPWQLML